MKPQRNLRLRTSNSTLASPGAYFSTYNYARDVANELLWGLSGLVGEEAAK